MDLSFKIHTIWCITPLSIFIILKVGFGFHKEHFLTFEDIPYSWEGYQEPPNGSIVTGLNPAFTLRGGWKNCQTKTGKNFPKNGQNLEKMAKKGSNLKKCQKTWKNCQLEKIAKNLRLTTNLKNDLDSTLHCDHLDHIFHLEKDWSWFLHPALCLIKF